MSKIVYNLPNELLSLILDKLDLIDLIRCRLVSKKFKCLVDSIKKNELIILGDHPFAIERCVSHYYFDPLNFKCSIKPEDFDFFKSPLFQNLFKNLKSLHLFLDLHAGFEFDSGLIEEFKNLESLNFSLYLFNDGFIINLPQLKEFTLFANYSRWIHPCGEKVYIKSQKLEKIKVNCCNNRFIFENPENIIYADFYDDDIAPIDISQFKKLKFLKCDTRMHGSDLKVIEELKELEELHFKGDLNDKAKEVINNLLELKSKNQNKIKKICFFEMEITKPIDKKKNYSRKEFEFFDYKTLSTDQSRTAIVFDKLSDLLKNNKEHLADLDKDKLIPRLPSCFFEKFINIRSVTVLKLEDEKELVIFLRNCKHLTKLDIRESRTKLSQSFIDQLPGICGNSLYDLKLGRLSDENLNYEPITRIRYLGDVAIKCEIDPIFALKMFKFCRNLIDISFYHRGSVMYITREYVLLYPVKDIESTLGHLDDIYKDTYDKKASTKLIKANFSKHQMYSFKYFNRELSRYGFTYDELESYIPSIEKLREKQVKKGKKPDVIDYMN